MAIQFDGELEQRIRQAAARRGTDVAATLAQLLAADEGLHAQTVKRKRERDEALRREFEAAMQDPLFIQDMEEAMRDFEHVDEERCDLRRAVRRRGRTQASQGPPRVSREAPLIACAITSFSMEHQWSKLICSTIGISLGLGLAQNRAPLPHCAMAH